MPRLSFALVLILLPLSGCPDEKPKGTSSVTPEYQKASEGLKARVPTTEGLPTNKAVNQMQKTMEETEARQEQHMNKAEEAATKE